MDVTARGIAFVQSTDNTRHWDQSQAIANSIQAALDAIDKIVGTYTPRTTDGAFGTTDTVIITAPDVTTDATTKLEIIIDWFGVNPNAGVTTGKMKIQRDGSNLKQRRWTTDATLVSAGGSMQTVDTPGAGTHSYTFVAIREIGPAGSVVNAGAGFECSITVKQFR